MGKFLSLILIFLGGISSADPQMPTDRATICGFLLDAELSPQQQLIISQDLQFLVNLKGEKTSLAHQHFFGSSKVSGRAYCEYLGKRIRKINYRKEMNSRLMAVNSGFKGEIVISDFYFKFSQMDRLSALIHEARHTLDTNSAHQICPKEIIEKYQLSYLEGVEACDNRYDGSYGYEYVWYESIFKHCTNCDDKMRIDAGTGALQSIKRISTTESQLLLLNQ